MSTTKVKRPLLVLALAVAAVATVATTASATSQWTAYHPTQAAFARAADGNCGALYKLLAPLGNPTALPAIAHKLAIVLPAFTMALRAQDELGSPVGQSAVVSRWMAAMTAYGRALTRIDAAAKAGNAAGVGAANAALNRAGTDSAALSKQLGLHVCFAS